MFVSRLLQCSPTSAFLRLPLLTMGYARVYIAPGELCWALTELLRCWVEGGGDVEAKRAAGHHAYLPLHYYDDASFDTRYTIPDSKLDMPKCRSALALTRLVRSAYAWPWSLAVTHVSMPCLSPLLPLQGPQGAAAFVHPSGGHRGMCRRRGAVPAAGGRHGGTQLGRPTLDTCITHMKRAQTKVDGYLT